MAILEKVKKKVVPKKKKEETYQPQSLLIHLESEEQKKVFQALCKTFRLKSELKEEDSPYDPEFMKEIEKSREAMKAGKKGLKVDLDNLWT